MAAGKKSENNKLLNKYAYDCLANEYDAKGKSNSLADLYELAGETLKENDAKTREEHIRFLLPKIPQYMHEKILAVETLRTDLNEFSSDCDESFFAKTGRHIEKVLSLFDKDNPMEMRIRNELYSVCYDIEEQINPTGRQHKFDILKKMVANIKQNDGSFDHNPLNVSAKRMEYFMSSVDVEDRLKLIDSIYRKTKNKDQYNYMSLKAKLKKEKAQKDAERKFLDREEKQLRYDDIMKKELPQAVGNQEKIKLYKEAVKLVNYQDWTRSRKFSAKIKIYNNLIPLYAAEGMMAEYENAKAIRESYLKAQDNTKIYASKKGYGRK